MAIPAWLCDDFVLLADREACFGEASRVRLPDRRIGQQAARPQLDVPVFSPMLLPARLLLCPRRDLPSPRQHWVSKPRRQQVVLHLLFHLREFLALLTVKMADSKDVVTAYVSHRKLQLVAVEMQIADEDPRKSAQL